ncbi:uncharacterized protein LOC122812898 [Protopterus annectens]|uniref:uncharacterized protein LOC122812898 n=1 Tax=Protopterus annectens TaxID=7888 RepID=UPI001CFAF638|nr:uncharacterized protein LOC122812898 [Protopterus annectens]
MSSRKKGNKKCNVTSGSKGLGQGTGVLDFFFFFAVWLKLLIVYSGNPHSALKMVPQKSDVKKSKANTKKSGQKAAKNETKSCKTAGAKLKDKQQGKSGKVICNKYKNTPGQSSKGVSKSQTTTITKQVKAHKGGRKQSVESLSSTDKSDYAEHNKKLTVEQNQERISKHDQKEGAEKSNRLGKSVLKKRKESHKDLQEKSTSESEEEEEELKKTTKKTDKKQTKNIQDASCNSGNSSSSFLSSCEEISEEEQSKNKEKHPVAPVINKKCVQKESSMSEANETQESEGNTEMFTNKCEEVNKQSREAEQREVEEMLDQSEPQGSSKKESTYSSECELRVNGSRKLKSRRINKSEKRQNSKPENEASVTDASSDGNVCKTENEVHKQSGVSNKHTHQNKKKNIMKKAVPLGRTAKLLNVDSSSKTLSKEETKTEENEKSEARVDQVQNLFSIMQAQKKHKSQINLISKLVKGGLMDEANDNLEGVKSSESGISKVKEHKPMLSKQTQMILTLTSKHKVMKDKLEDKPKDVTARTEVSSDPESNNADSTNIKKKKQLSNSNESASSCNIEKSSQPHHSKSVQRLDSGNSRKLGKVIDTVKLVGVRNPGNSANITEEKELAEEHEVVKDSNNVRGRKRVSALRRVVVWLNQKLPKSLRVKSKIVTATSAVGISGWLMKRLRRKKTRKAFKRRIAAKVVSTAGLARWLGSPSGSSVGRPEAIKEAGKGDSSYLLETLEEALVETELSDLQTELVEEDMNKCDFSRVSESNPEIEDNFEGDETTNNTDARYAIVLPRVHHLVKSKASSSSSLSSSSSAGHNRSVDSRLSKGLPSRNTAVSSQTNYKDPDSLKYFAVKGQQLSRTTNGYFEANQKGSDILFKGDIIKDKGKAGVITLDNAKFGQERQTYTRSHLSNNYNITEIMGSQTKTWRRKEEKDESKILQEKSINSHEIISELQNSADREELDVSNFYLEEEDADKEVARIMENSVFETTAEVHWSQKKSTRCDPVEWLNAETLLPHQTIEKLSKWTIYKEQDMSEPHIIGSSKSVWETEGISEDIFEVDFTHKQCVTEEIYEARKGVPSEPHNLNIGEKMLLNELKSQTKVRIMKPDKEGGVVLYGTEEYNNAITQLLLDTNTYSPVSKNEITIAYGRIDSLLEEYLLENRIDGNDIKERLY